LPILDHDGTPLIGIRLSIGRTSLSVVSDAQGYFRFADHVPSGKVDLFVDGRELRFTRAGEDYEYPALHFETAVIQGQDNQLPHPIYLPPVEVSRAVMVGGDADVILTLPYFEGFEMRVRANSVTFPDGSREGPVVVSAVHADRLPMVPPGMAGRFAGVGWTIQPTNTRFDPPIEVRIPNTDGLSPGRTLPIVQWDHDLATFVPMGHGTVSEDGTQIVSDPGSGITKAGWGGGGPPPPPPNDGCGPDPECDECEEHNQTVTRCPICRSKTLNELQIVITPDAAVAADVVDLGADRFTAIAGERFGFRATLGGAGGDAATIKWEVETVNAQRVTGIEDLDPADGKGDSIAFDVGINRFTTGSVNESPPLHVRVTADYCGISKTINVEQDITDIIRQEYQDFRTDVAGFTLSVPDRARFSNTVLYQPNRGLNNPYLVNHGISLDDPSGIAAAVANTYRTSILQLSVDRYQAAFQAAQAAGNAALAAQIRTQWDQVLLQHGAGGYVPTMTSAWRSPRHNEQVGGVACSNHLKGGAADMVPGAVPPNINTTQATGRRENWCELRAACGTEGYTECLLEIPPGTAGWNSDHACTGPFARFHAVHSGMRSACN